MGALILHYKMRAAGCQRYKNDRPEGIMNSEKIYFSRSTWILFITFIPFSSW